MRPALLSVLALAACAALRGADPVPDVKEIVRRSVSRENVSMERAKNYTYLERVEQREFDGAGRRKKTESKTFDVSMMVGEPYRRLVAVNDKPLAEKDRQREAEKQSRELAKRQRDAARNPNRVTDEEKEWEERRKFAAQLVDAFTWRVAGEEVNSGRPLWVLEATPRPGFKPQGRRASILPKIKGKLWVDKADYHWVRTEAEVIDTISFGLFLARLSPGATIRVQQARVNEEVWLPQRALIRFDARLALLKRMNAEVEVTYRDYRKFQTDATVTTGEAVP